MRCDLATGADGTAHNYDGRSFLILFEQDRSCQTYDQAFQYLRDWYNWSGKHTRILIKWQLMTLSKSMTESPTQSEEEVFRNFVAKIMSLQMQLNSKYHMYTFLRDRLLTAVDISAIQIALRDRLSRTSNQDVNRLADQLAHNTQSAGSISVCVVQE